MASDDDFSEPTDRPMSRTYLLVVIIEVIVVAGLWLVGWYFAS